MKTIISMAMNPSIDKSARVERVIVERKLYCKMPAYELGGGDVNAVKAFFVELVFQYGYNLLRKHNV